jgi:hypothetical protein
VRRTDCLTSKCRQPRAKARWERDFARGCAMRSKGVIVACMGLALLMGGCDSLDSRYFRYGIGTDLYSTDIVETTQYQDLYLTELVGRPSRCFLVPKANV